MERPITTLTHVVATLWRTDAPLTGAGFLLLAAFAASLAGLWLDPREIIGAPAWLKPAKFGISTAIYSLTFAWFFTYLPSWTRTRRIAGWTTAAALVLEVALIAVQAWRGTTSHFNVGTPLDVAVFAVMGIAIGVQTVAAIAVAVALWRQPFADRAIGWALRLGLGISIVGAASGGMMVKPTDAQVTEARTTGRMALSGAHTVGAVDGGPGVPGTGWSREHGDLRVPHFLGLHAMQALPLMAIALRRRRSTVPVQVRLIIATAGSYMLLFATLLWQAFRGQSVIDPDRTTMTALLLWGALTAAAFWVAGARRERIPAQAPVY